MNFPEDTLLALRNYDGLIYTLTCGYWLKFDVREADVSDAVPHGMRYSFTMHSHAGMRVMGFDNAHRVSHAGGRFVVTPTASDHWHRDESDEGRPYLFVSADQLIVDFFTAVEAKLNDLGLPFVIKE